MLHIGLQQMPSSVFLVILAVCRNCKGCKICLFGRTVQRKLDHHSVPSLAPAEMELRDCKPTIKWMSKEWPEAGLDKDMAKKFLKDSGALLSCLLSHNAEQQSLLATPNHGQVDGHVDMRTPDMWKLLHGGAGVCAVHSFNPLLHSSTIAYSRPAAA